MEVFKEFTFEAAHKLPYVPNGHKCGRLHGHSYRVTIYVGGKCNEDGWVLDFADIKTSIQPLLQVLDHSYLNDVEGLSNPTCESLAKWIWFKLYLSLPGLSKISVMETADSGCIYSGGE